MLLSFAPLFVAGASLAIQAVGASPIRIIAISSRIEVVGPTAIGTGHASTAEPFRAPRMGKACGGMRNKQLELSNVIRKAFGMTLIEENPPHRGTVHILPMPFTPVDMPAVDRPTGKHVHFVEATPVSYHRPSSSPPSTPLADRVHSALTELGTWEARAVAFVFGCGIGVLLRMIWVLAILVVRGISPARSDEQAEEAQYTLVIEAVDALPAYADEKAPAYVEDDKAHTALD